MNTAELRRSEVLSRVKRGELKLIEAAELPAVSYRQAMRLKKRYLAGGAQSLRPATSVEGRTEPSRRECGNAPWI
jgi:hypothetical protein